MKRNHATEVEADFRYSNTEQAAMVLMSLPQAEAVAVMRELSPQDVQRLSEVMQHLQDAGQGVIANVLTRFLSDASQQSAIRPYSGERIRGLLDAALGVDRGRLLGERLSALGADSQLSKLGWLDARSIARVIASEHPQIQAVLLACLSSRQASEVLLSFTEAQQHDLLGRLAGLETISSLALQELEAVLESHFSGGAEISQDVSGERLAAGLLKELDVQRESELLQALSANQPERAARIEDLMFDFAGLTQLRDDELSLLLAPLAIDLLATALRDVDAVLRARLIQCLSRDRRRELNRMLLAQTPRSREAGILAREEIVAVARRMAAVGEIVLDSRKLGAM